MKKEVLVSATPAVPETTSIYQIYTRNFTDKGDLASAEARLPDIATMGFGWVYLTPVQPSGVSARKGALGSPYAIADYRALDPSLGTIADFRHFIAAAKKTGLRVMLDVVYNHSSPDSVLAENHPEWFLRDGEGKLSRKCHDWSDVADFDFSSSRALWDELIASLAFWRDRGVDGFRCDVASLVPVDFWVEARRRIDPDRSMLWLAESVHPHFLREMRRRGFGGWSEPELHAAFDLTYDYDGWERLEPCWTRGADCRRYLDYLFAQETLYPAGARKIRYLENHDQIRAAERFGRGTSLGAWTAMYMFLPGCTFAYMGQELALTEKPDLFDRDPIDRASGDIAFRDFFAVCFAATQKAKAGAPDFAWKKLAAGAYLFTRESRDGKDRYGLLANTRPKAAAIRLPHPFRGKDMLGKGRIEFGLSGALQPGVLFAELED